VKRKRRRSYNDKAYKKCRSFGAPLGGAAGDEFA
jgi:hypothetical protein